MDHSHHIHQHAAEGAYRLPLPATPGPEYSELNHHIAGAVVLLVGLCAILLYYRPRTFSFLNYVWPASLLALGIYLVLYSDPNGWPSAYRSLGETFREDRSAFQHKVYALLLVLFGGVELLRASRVLKRDFWRYAFPAFALIGTVYLIFHEQGKGEHTHGGGPATHTAITFQHLIYIILGLQAVAAWILAAMRRITGPWAWYIWPSLISLLGIALILYRE